MTNKTVDIPEVGRFSSVGHVHFMGVIRIPREEYERVLREGIPRGRPVSHDTH